jgi:DNA-directed RNA polymerase subunit beta'
MKPDRQLAGMRGHDGRHIGKTIEIPIRSNFREASRFSNTFISSRGATYGLAIQPSDSRLRISDSRLYDVSQDVIISEVDCGTKDGIWIREISDGNQVIEKFEDRLRGRYAADPLS